jgi:PAS domain S-box-containing protein
MYQAPIPEMDFWSVTINGKLSPADDVAQVIGLQGKIMLSGHEAVFNEIVVMARSVCGASAAAINLFDSNQQWITAIGDPSAYAVASDLEFCRNTMLADEFVAVPDIRPGRRPPDDVTGPSASPVGFHAGVPLITDRGQRIGSLCIIDDAPRELTQVQQASLRSLGHIVVQLIAARVAEAVREDSARRFIEMANAAPVLIWMSGPDNGCVFANKRWLEFTGRTLAEESGDGWWEPVHPDDRCATRATYLRSFDARREFRMEYRLRRRDSEYRWIVETGVPGRDSSGAFLGYIGSCIDVTDARREHEALRESYGAQRAILDAALDGYLLTDLDGTLLDVNAAYCRQSGYSREELLDLHVGDLMQESAAELSADTRKIVEAGGAQFEPVHRRKDGSNWHAEARVVYDREGGGRLFGFYRDITERKRAEVMLHASAAHLRAIIETEPKGVATVGPDGVLQEINAAGLAMLEADSVAQVNGYGLTNVVGSEHRSAFGDFHRRVIGGVGGTLEYEIVGLRGTHRGLQTHAAPLRTMDGSVATMLGITRDVSERKQLERAVLEASGRERRTLCPRVARWTRPRTHRAFVAGDEPRVVGSQGGLAERRFAR